ncbi:hypothetical protein COU74_02100 [Candidatus Peregrinibacteria bacterium CG10_big_fil_rev_8_21_14_0_10_36_19]|nr:MAG: hypothetical protein COU74_02100 [Candidatus Peregrinibacteria bacterium CG10_big_fil_rev_8_21_14_0_10_36_19]
MENEDAILEEIKDDFENLKSEYERAKVILESINSYEEEFKMLKRTLDTEIIESEKNIESSRVTKSEIDTYKAQAQTQLESLENDLIRIKDHIENMDAAFSKFSEIKGNVFAKGEEVEGVMVSIRGLNDDIITIKNDAQTTLQQIKDSLISVQEKIEEMQTSHIAFLEIKAKLDDEKTGLAAVFKLVSGIYEKSKTLHAEIQSFRDDSQDLMKEIKTAKKESDELKNKISENLAYTNERKAEIIEATGLIIDTSFSETFERRRLQILGDIKFWRNWFIGSTIALAVVVIILQTTLVDIDKSNVITAFLQRLLLTSPLVGFVIFSGLQYTNDRSLIEKYAFKASSAAAIRSHIEFLTRTFSVSNEKIIEFSKNTFSTIYKEPYSSDGSLDKRVENIEKSFKNQKKSKKTKGNLSTHDIVKIIKDLKSIIPDESLFEKVLNVFEKIK